MVVRVKTGASSWANVSKIRVKTGVSSWADVVVGRIKDSASSWKNFFIGTLTPAIASKVIIAKSSPDATTKLITLTGTNYAWTDADTLIYKFYNGITELASGTITNPITSNTKTYSLTTSDVTPNQTNSYTFYVLATNTTYNTELSSTSTAVTIDGITDLSITNTAQNYTDLTFQWTGGTYASGFIYQVQTYVGDVGGGWDSFRYTSNSSITISALSDGTYLTSGKKYQIRVKGISGTSTANQGYSGNWAYQVGTTNTAPAPSAVSYPPLTGSAVALTSLSASNGSYNNRNTNIAVSSRIIATLTPSSIIQGQTSDSSTVKSSDSTTYLQTYSVTQTDATNKSLYFYARDAVTGLDGIVYYFYSSGIKATIGTVTDNFNRSVSGGIGTMSSGFTYSGSSTSPAWSVNGSAGASSAVPGAVSTPNDWGLRSIETGGKTDITMSVGAPLASGGIGVGFWVTAYNSWWSAMCVHSSSTIYTDTCNAAGGSNTSGWPTTPATGTGSACNKQSTTAYPCTSTGGSSTTQPTAGLLPGNPCDITSSTTYACNQVGSNSTTYPSNVGTGSGQNCNVTSVTTYACNMGGGSSTSYPSNVGTGQGQQCDVTSNTTYACGSTQYSSSSSVTAGNNAGNPCNITSSTSYACNAAGGSSTTSPSNVGTGSGQVCNVTSNTTYPCTSAGGSSTTAPTTGTQPGDACDVTSSTSYACLATRYNTSTAPTAGNGAGEVCNVTGGTAYAFVSTTGPLPSASSTTCTAANFGKYRTGSQVNLGGGIYRYDYCNSTTTYQYSLRSTSGTVTYSWNSRSGSGTTTYTWDTRSTTGTVTYFYYLRSTSPTVTYFWNTRTTTPTTIYYWDKRTTSPTITYSWNTRNPSGTTTYTWDTNTAVPTTTYKTYLNLYAAESGSSVNLKNSNEVHSSTTAWPSVSSISASTSSNTITASLYGSGGSQIGTTTVYTASSPVKSDAYGSTAAGIIKGYSPGLDGYLFDNLSIS